MYSEELQRYYAVIDNVPAFKEALNSPLPGYILTNTSRIRPARLAEFLERDGFEVTPLPWLPSAFRIGKANTGLGNHWTYLTGLFQIQEASAMIPALVLAPQPGERVLDLCAAPGNKTVQMAVILNNRGTVVANDPVRGRLKPLRAAIYRLGLINVTTTCRDGLSYPRSAGDFDCVLADVPCSCEGTSRKRPKVLRRPVKNSAHLISKQTGLLSRAIQYCRDGGKILYSTCTYAPEENELVVNEMLKKYPGRVSILPIRVPGLKTAEGLTSWGSTDLHPDLKHTIRIWPHQNDTGGFYMALLRKEGTRSGTGPGLPCVDDPEYCPGRDDGQTPLVPRDKILGLLYDRFGLQGSALDHIRLFVNSSGIVHALAGDHVPPLIPDRVMGLPLIHTAMRYPKLTTNGAMAFGHLAGRHVIELSPGQMRVYFTRNTFPVSGTQTASCDSDGYVILRYEGIPIGVGFYNRLESRVASLFPKKMAVCQMAQGPRSRAQGKAI